MTDGGSIRAGGVHFDIGANAAALKRSLKESQGEVSRSTKAMTEEAVKAAKAQEAELSKVVERLRKKLSLVSLTDFERGGIGTQLDEATKQLGEVRGNIPQQAIPDTLFGRLGDKASSSITNAITKGLVGVAAVNAVDQGLREIGDRIRSGIALTAADLGGILGDGVTKALESIPVAGPLGRIVAELIDSMSGGFMQLERDLERTRNLADRLNASFGSITDRLREIERSRLTGTAAELERINRSYDELLAKLGQELREKAGGTSGSNDGFLWLAADVGRFLSPGVGTIGTANPVPVGPAGDPQVIAEARAAIDRPRSAEIAALAERVAAGFGEALENIDRLTGAFDQQAAMLRQVDKLAEGIAKSYADIGRAEEGLARAEAIRERAAANLQRAEAAARLAEIEKQAAAAQREADAAAIQAAREAEQTVKDIDAVIAGLERRLGDIGRSDLDRLFADLRALGAGDDLIERALSMQAAIEKASIESDPKRRYGNFSTFLASRLDQQFANEPARKLDDKVGRIDRNLERLLREIKDNDGGLAFGA